MTVLYEGSFGFSLKKQFSLRKEGQVRERKRKEKRPDNREHGDKTRRTDKNSINFWDSVFPRRKTFGVLVLYFGHACLAQDFIYDLFK